MRIDLTTEEMTAVAEKFLNARCEGIDPSQPNLRFCPSLEACDGSTRTIIYRFHTYGWMSNPMGVTHGGMISAILDASMGVLCTVFYGVMTPTITMTTNYCRPVPLDADILVRAKVSYTGGTNCQVSAEMYLPGEEDNPLATTCGVYYTAHAGK